MIFANITTGCPSRDGSGAIVSEKLAGDENAAGVPVGSVKDEESLSAACEPEEDADVDEKLALKRALVAGEARHRALKATEAGALSGASDLPGSASDFHESTQPELDRERSGDIMLSSVVHFFF